MKTILYTLHFLIFTWCSLVAADSRLIDIPQDELLDLYLANQSDVYSADQNTNKNEPSNKVIKSSLEIQQIQINNSDTEPTRNHEVTELDVIIMDDTDETVVSLSADEMQQTQTNNSNIKSTQIHEATELEITLISKAEIIAPLDEDENINTYRTPAKLYCYDNPNSKECLYSEFLSFCKKDPQTSDCHRQLQQFYTHCISFPKEHNCKQASLFSSCKRNPNSTSCISHKNQFCRNTPDALFCS